MNQPISIVLCASALAILSTASMASAQSPPKALLRQNPEGAGTDAGAASGEHRAVEGVEMAAFAGGGYGVGFGARIGYTFSPGVYVGGQGTDYANGVAFLGAEVGYKLFVSYHWELRPYVFAGPAFIRAGDSRFGRSSTATEMAVQPGFLGAYHFSNVFLFGEARAHVAPSPGALAVFAGIGFAP